MVGIELKGLKLKPKIINENVAQNIPANTTVVNFGVSGFHLIVTVYRANPVADIKPIRAPKALPEIESLMIIMHTPIKAITMEIRVDRRKTSPKKK